MSEAVKIIICFPGNTSVTFDWVPFQYLVTDHLISRRMLQKYCRMKNFYKKIDKILFFLSSRKETNYKTNHPPLLLDIWISNVMSLIFKQMSTHHIENCQFNFNRIWYKFHHVPGLCLLGVTGNSYIGHKSMAQKPYMYFQLFLLLF